METALYEYPCLRPVEAIPDRPNGRVILRDPTQLAAGMLVVGEAEFTLLALMDGSRGLMDIQKDYARQLGQILLSRELHGFLEQLAKAGFLAGPSFEAYYSRLAEEYTASTVRPLRDPDSYGAPARKLPAYLNGAMDEVAPGLEPGKGTLKGLVAPHLDYPRGMPCYSTAYARLRGAAAPRRVVVLGTNHFGRSESVVATDKDFRTPWGVVPADRDFLSRLQAECRGNLMPYEMDHLREHSIELHAIWLHHVLGDRFRLVAALCPDPTGPHGTAPREPGGVDLREFALALRELIRRDPEPTLVIASADLSHVGQYFGDEEGLSESMLGRVRAADEAALAAVARNDPEGLRDHMTGSGNETRWCSVGCLYAAMVALGEEAEPAAIRYHQAVTPEIENAVTCVSLAFYG